MPGSLTTPGWPSARVGALVQLPSAMGAASAPRTVFLSRARWLACALPCRRFAVDLAAADARLGADAGRYSFIVSDSHRLPLAGLPAHTHR
jgi:hypothetical protein